MQALFVYILLRLQEGQTPDNNFDLLLISSMWVSHIPALPVQHAIVAHAQ
jgi:hypothetical protein